MRRIRDNKENESLENAYKAYDKYSKQKHSRDYVKAFDAELQHNLEEIVRQIADAARIAICLIIVILLFLLSEFVDDRNNKNVE